MIIFNLDGTLANCEHRRHFVDAGKNPNVIHGIPPSQSGRPVIFLQDYHKETGEVFEPDWKSFYEACDKDEAIKPVIEVFLSLSYEPYKRDVNIWSGRCESVREKTIKWIEENIPEFEGCNFIDRILKMRPEGDTTPDDQLKERWLKERCADLMEAVVEGKVPKDHDIEYVFDDSEKCCDMWRRHEIFVFNCYQ